MLDRVRCSTNARLTPISVAPPVTHFRKGDTALDAFAGSGGRS